MIGRFLLRGKYKATSQISTPTPCVGTLPPTPGIDAGLDCLAGVFEAALKKFEQGALKYGNFNPASDARDFLQETEAEVLDAINYLAMFLLRMRAMQRKAAKQAGNGTEKRRLRKLKSGTMAGQNSKAKKEGLSFNGLTP